MKEYYVLSLKWSKDRHDGLFVWWQTNNSGYTTVLKSAGRYTEEQITEKLWYYHNGESTLAIPCEAVEEASASVVFASEWLQEQLQKKSRPLPTTLEKRNA